LHYQQGQVVGAFDASGKVADFLQARRKHLVRGFGSMPREELFDPAETVLVSFAVENLREAIRIKK
jgi:hypothetical protein